MLGAYERDAFYAHHIIGWLSGVIGRVIFRDNVDARFECDTIVP